MTVLASGAPRSRWFAALVLVPVVLAGMAGAGITAVAAAPVQTESDGDGQVASLSVTAGRLGVVRAGALVPITVSVTAPRLVTGELRIRAGWARQIIEIPIEVAAGSNKQYTVAVPGPAFDPGSMSVDVSLGTESGEAEAATSVEMRPDQQVVGVLPGLVAPDEAVVLDDTGIVLRAVALEADDLSVPGALGPLSLLAVTDADLSDLDQAALDAVLRWVATGGVLLVDAAADGSFPALPDEWQPGSRRWISAGLGEVRATGGALAGGRWNEVETAATTVNIDSGSRFGSEALEQTLARDAGVRLPDIKALLIGMALYIVIVGPVVAIVLRRRRQLVWLVVPGIAVVATAAVLVLGQGTRIDRLTVFTAVVETGPHTPEVFAMVGQTSPSGGTVRLSAPSGSIVAGAVSGAGFDPFAESASVTTDGTTSTLVRRLPTGGLGTARMLGPIGGVRGRLTVAGTAVDGAVQATVTNDTDYDLEDVAIFLGADRYQSVGSLPAGESTTVAVDRRVQDQFAPRELGVWRDATGWDAMPSSDSVVAYSAWLESNQRWQLAQERPGLLTAVGWTRAARLDVAGGVDRGRTAIVGRADVTTDAGSLRTDVLALDFENQIADDRVGGLLPVLTRLRLAPGVSASGAMVEVAGGASQVEVRTAGGWTVIHEGEADFAKVAGPPISLSLPSGLTGDTVLLRIRYPLESLFSGAVLGQARALAS